MNTIVIGLLGTSLDMGLGRGRWEYWRPSVGITMQDDLLVNEFHLLHSAKSSKLTELIGQDISTVSPGTKLVPHLVEFDNPWDFEEVYSVLLDFCKGFTFDIDNNEYLIHITTGTHVAQICLFLLIESRHMPAKLLQSSPDGPRHKNIKGTHSIIDLDLSRYDKIASRFKQETNDDISFLKSGIETQNADFNRLIEMIEKVAIHSREPILLTGPTGAGKSLLASRIYGLKKCRNQLKGGFVEVNCATLRGDLAMSTLFGHKRGAYTGAGQDRPGLLKTAEEGIVFLDEIGELGLDEQAMLL
ncbi:MAG: AAA family ATPase, partial [bacterium]|nr:AAA family ATPase [bacterium]